MSANAYSVQHPFSINLSIDTMQERLSVRETPVSADSKNKLIAIHHPERGTGQHHTDLMQENLHGQKPTSQERVEIYDELFRVFKLASRATEEVSHLLYEFQTYRSKLKR